MAIQVKGLDFTYQPGTTSERHALRNVSLRVADGEFLAIVGASAVANRRWPSISMEQSFRRRERFSSMVWK